MNTRPVAPILAILALILPPAIRADLTSVSPAGPVNIRYNKVGTFVGPPLEGLSFSLSGTGTVTFNSNTCFGARSNSSTDSWTLPADVRIWNNWPNNCVIRFTGSSTSIDVTLTIVSVPDSQKIISTNATGDLLAGPACTAPNSTARWPYWCSTVGSVQKRPGGDWTPPAQGTSFTDATWGGTVTMQTAGTRTYVNSHNISPNGQYLVMINSPIPPGQDTRLHRINHADNTLDFTNVSCSGGGCICDQNYSNGVWLHPDLDGVGYCVSTTGDIKQFAYSSPPNATLTSVNYNVATHGAAYGWGSGFPSNDGHFAVFDTDLTAFGGRTCVVNIRGNLEAPVCTNVPYDVGVADPATDAITLNGGTVPHQFQANSFPIYMNSTGAMPGGVTANTLYCVETRTTYTITLKTYVAGACTSTHVDITTTGTGQLQVHYYPRNTTLAFQPSAKTGKQYMLQGSDNPSTISLFEYDKRAGTLTLVGQNMPQLWAPNASLDGAYWGNDPIGRCQSDCITAGHLGITTAMGEPWLVTSALGNVTNPAYDSPSNIIRMVDYRNGGIWTGDKRTSPALVGLVAYTDYYPGASKAPSMGGTQELNSQGGKAAWPIASCTGSGAAITFTLRAGADLSASGIVDGVTSVQIDGMNGMSSPSQGLRAVVTTHTATTFQIADSRTGSCTANTASMTIDTYVDSLPNGIMVSVIDRGWNIVLSKAYSMSYGPSVAGSQGSWMGITSGAPGYTDLTFPTQDLYGRKICWTSNYGHTEHYWVSCVDTGLDMDETTEPHHFDRHGHGVYIRAISGTGATGIISPTDRTYTCSLAVHQLSDFSDAAVFTSGALAGGGTVAITGLSVGQQYYGYARCGATAAKYQNYGIFRFVAKG